MYVDEGLFTGKRHGFRVSGGYRVYRFLVTQKFSSNNLTLS